MRDWNEACLSLQPTHRLPAGFNPKSGYNEGTQQLAAKQQRGRKTDTMLILTNIGYRSII